MSASDRQKRWGGKIEGDVMPRRYFLPKKAKSPARKMNSHPEIQGDPSIPKTALNSLQAFPISRLHSSIGRVAEMKVFILMDGWISAHF